MMRIKKPREIYHLIFFFTLVILSLSFISAGNFSLFPNPGLSEAGNSILYSFNFSNSTNCLAANIILNHTEIVTINSRGFGYLSINISNLSQVPLSLCEYKDGTLRKNHSFSDIIFNTIYARNLNLSENLIVLGNSSFNGTLMPRTSLTFDIGSGALRWRNLYVTNISADYVDITNDLTAIGNITGAYFYGSGAFLTNLNVTGNITGIIDASNITNEYWVNVSGDTMTGNLNMGNNNITSVRAITTNYIHLGGSSLSIGMDELNYRLNITSAGNIYGMGPWDTDDLMAANELIIRRSRTLPYPYVKIHGYGISVFDGTVGENLMINLTTVGNYIGVGNVTANWFKGKFNWTEISKYLGFDGSTLDFNETELNLSIDSRTTSITHNATSIVTISGTLDAGNLTSILFPEDDDTYNVSEDVGADPLTIAINFSNVSSLDSIIGRVYYDGGLGHEIQLEIQRSDTLIWENYIDITDTTDFVNIYVPVFDPELHVFASGDVAIRFNHVQSGIPTHNFYIDYLAIVDGWTALTVADHDSLGGRDSISNHPWALPTNGSLRNASSVIVTGNVTASWFLGNINASYIQNNLWIEDSQEGNLNVNRSNFWDNYNVVGDLPHDSLSGAGTIDTWAEIDVFINDTEESSLNVNSSDFWDNYNVPTDLNYRLLLYWENITGRPTHLSNFTDNILWTAGFNTTGDTRWLTSYTETDPLWASNFSNVAFKNQINVFTTNQTIQGYLNVTGGILLENNATISRSGTDTKTWLSESGNWITQFGT